LQAAPIEPQFAVIMVPLHARHGGHKGCRHL